MAIPKRLMLLCNSLGDAAQTKTLTLRCLHVKEVRESLNKPRLSYRLGKYEKGPKTDPSPSGVVDGNHV